MSEDHKEMEELAELIHGQPTLLTGDEDKKLDKPVMKGEVFIAMPSEGVVSIDLLDSYIHLIKPKHYFRSTNMIPLDKARNSLVADFLVKSPSATHILFWDDDVIPPPTGLLQLWLHNEPVVSGLYFQKGPPYHPLMTLKVRNDDGGEGYTHLIQWKEGQPYYVDGIGMGFCLIRKDVFQEIDWPPFSFTEFSEDYSFCTKLRDANIKIKVDTGVICKHLADRVPVGPDQFKMHQNSLIMKQVRFGEE